MDALPDERVVISSDGAGGGFGIRRGERINRREQEGAGGEHKKKEGEKKI